MTDCVTRPGVPGALRVPGNKGIWAGITCEFVNSGAVHRLFRRPLTLPEEIPLGAARLSLLVGTVITLVMVSSSLCIAASVARFAPDNDGIAALDPDRLGLLVALGLSAGQVSGIPLEHGVAFTVGGIFFTVYYYLTINHLVHAFWGILGIGWCWRGICFGAIRPRTIAGWRRCVNSMPNRYHLVDDFSRFLRWPESRCSSSL